MELYYNLWNCKATFKPQGSLDAAGEVPKIILLHGMGGTGALWRPIAANLEEHFSVLAPDQRGHGKSRLEGSSGFTPLDYGQDVIDTLGVLKFHPAWCVGHSMGVRTALAAAHLRPDWVQGLILVDLGLSGAAGGGLGENLEQFLKILPLTFQSREEAKKFMEAHCPDPSIAQYLMAVSVRNAVGQVSFPFEQQALIQTIQAAANSTVREWVKELSLKGMKILLLRGQRSLVWSQEEFEEEKKYFANSPSVQFLEVPGAGHGLPFEKRAELIQLILEFTGIQNSQTVQD